MQNEVEAKSYEIGDHVEIKLTGRITKKNNGGYSVAYRYHPLDKSAEEEIKLSLDYIVGKIDVVPDIGDSVWTGSQGGSVLGKVCYVNKQARMILVEGFNPEDLYRVYMSDLREQYPNTFSCAGYLKLR
jgi:hypothetical protein